MLELYSPFDILATFLGPGTYVPQGHKKHVTQTHSYMFS